MNVTVVAVAMAGLCGDADGRETNGSARRIPDGTHPHGSEPAGSWPPLVTTTARRKRVSIHDCPHAEARFE